MTRKTKVKMPKRVKSSNAEKQGGARAAANAANQKVAELTKMVNQMTSSNRKSKLSPLGQLAFDAGNTISSFFGAGKIFGSGAYKMEGGNTCFNTSSQVPVMHSAKESVRIKHREYITDITVVAQPAFRVLNTLSVNPGLSETFPYLAAIANNFQEYKFHGLVFEFKSTSATAISSTTNVALGALSMAAQYRSDAVAPATKLLMMNEFWSTDGVPSSNVYLPIECSPKENPMAVQYIRTAPLTTLQDQKFYDLCTLYVASSGTPSNNVIGELWVTYDVELFKPSMSDTNSNFSGGCTHFYGAGCTTAEPFGTGTGTGASYYKYDNIGITTYNVNNTGLITFPSTLAIGTRLLLEFAYFAGTSATTAGATLVGATASSFFLNDSQNYLYYGGGTTTMGYSQVIVITALNATYALPVTISGTTTVDIYISIIPSDDLA